MTRHSRLRRQQLRSEVQQSRPHLDELPSGRGRQGRILAAIGAVAVLAGVSFWLWKMVGRGNRAGDVPSPGATAEKDGLSPKPDKPRPGNPKADFPLAHGREQPPGHLAQEPLLPKKDADNFLEAFTNPNSVSDNEGGGTALPNEELEKHFQDLTAITDRLDVVKRRFLAARSSSNQKELDQTIAERERLVAQFDRKSPAFEKEVAAARRARTDDPVPIWLTGELLILVGGEPEQILPHLQQAAARGLKRPRLQASLARADLESNQFAAAFGHAVQALDQGPQDAFLWDAYSRSAFATEQFAAVIERLDKAFPTSPPDWATAIRRDAVDGQDRWQAEQAQRLVDAKANLPRVRLTIEHRRFTPGPAGARLSTVESTGREDVTLELFEDQAPATVANFLYLVSTKFYDGTKFHLAVPNTLVTGGDPNTKNDDPSDDGTGGPGYVIPDEFKAPGARQHFRGSLSLVNTGPRSAGSQFFITLTPQVEMNGHFTVFGRVIEGQVAVDRITRGRTTREVGHFGKIIPGDLIVKAEVLRKRDHEYKVIRERP